MNREMALKILSDNDESINNSFLDYIHEKCIFDEKSYWEYYDCLITLGKCKTHNEDKEVIKQILHTYSYVLSSFVHHFDPNDGYELNNIPNDYNEYIENLNFAISAYFTDDYSSEKSFGLQRHC